VSGNLVEDARTCLVLSRARGLASWVGASGRPVTAKGVLRPADAVQVAKATGVETPRHVRSAADVEQLHHAWVAAQAAGLLVVDGGRATAGSGPGIDEDPLQVWLAALEAVLAGESRDPGARGGAVACRLVLTALSGQPSPQQEDIEVAVHQMLREGDDVDDVTAMFDAFRRGVMPVDEALEVLAEFGAVDDEARLTPLGGWALEQLREHAGETVTPDLPVETLLRRLASADDDQAAALFRRWCGDRAVIESAAVLLRAAGVATPVERVAAVDVIVGWGEPLLPVWETVADIPALAPHARAVLAAWERGPDPDDACERWLTVERALATRDRDGVETACFEVEACGGPEALRDSGHPAEADLHAAVADFFGSGRRLSLFQLKIALDRFRPPVWRRVLVPASATLADLHAVIRVVLGWGDGHLHSFTVNGARYSDPYYQVDGCGDEEAVRLSRAFPRVGATVSYVYDFGDWWQHTITLEKAAEAGPSVSYPSCLAGLGDAPVEDWNPEYPEDPTPFDSDDINRRLADLTAASSR